MRTIKGYDGLYAVTKSGEVYSYRSGKFLKQTVDSNGYLKVNLCKDGAKKTHLVHRLVAEAFIPNPDNLPCINHVSENKLNNRVENLEYCSHAYNNAYGTRITRIQRAVYCHELNKLFGSIRDAAKELGADASKIVKVCNGKLKSTHGYTFSYGEV